MSSVASYLHTEQVCFLLPFSVQVAAFVTVHSPNMCTAFPLTSSACPQVAACQWSVALLVQPSEYACPFADMSSVASYLHTEQVRFLLPFSVQVAVFVTVQSPNVWAVLPLTSSACSQVAACQWFVSSFVHSVANLCVCASFSIASVAVYPHTLQLLSLLPSASSVASLVTVHSPNVWAALPLTSVACSQVAACQWSVASLVQSDENLCVWSSFARLCSSLYEHTLQLRSFLPSVSSVASTVVFHSPNVCVAFPLTSFVCSQVAACQWSVASLVQSFEKLCSCMSESI